MEQIRRNIQRKPILQLFQERKRDYLIPIFKDFIDKGYITEYHFNMNVHPAMADFDFSCGGKGAIQLEEYRPDEN